MDEFSCPRCRSNLYDLISGCLSCGGGRVKGANLPTKTSQATIQSQHKNEAERRKYLDEWAERAKQRKLAKEKKQEKQRKKLLAEEQLKKENKKILKEKQREEKRQRLQAEVSQVSHSQRCGNILTKAERRKERLERLAESRRVYTEGGLKGLFEFGKTSMLCPFCESTINVEKMYKHFNKAHLSQLSFEDKIYLQNIKSTRRLDVSNLERMYELLKQHEPPKVQNNEATEQTPVRQTYTNVTKESFQQSFYDERDASRSYAHRFRENGRFGSHPLHDDYDDESFPD